MKFEGFPDLTGALAWVQEVPDSNPGGPTKAFKELENSDLPKAPFRVSTANFAETCCLGSSKLLWMELSPIAILTTQGTRTGTGFPA